MVNDSKLTIAKQVCIVNNTHRKKNNNTTKVPKATQRQYVCVKTACLQERREMAMSDKNNWWHIFHQQETRVGLLK